MSIKGVMVGKNAPAVEVLQFSRRPDGETNVEDLTAWSDGNLYDCGFGDVCLEIINGAGVTVTRLSPGDRVVKTGDDTYVVMAPDAIRAAYGDLVSAADAEDAPVVEEPVVDEPVVKEPVVDEPVVEEVPVRHSVSKKKAGDGR
jgi:hypothetical protein